MEQAGSVFPDLVEASMTEMRLRSKMAASCLGYSFARSQTNSCGGITASTEGRMSPIFPLRNAPGLLDLLHYVSLSSATTLKNLAVDDDSVHVCRLCRPRAVQE